MNVILKNVAIYIPIVARKNIETLAELFTKLGKANEMGKCVTDRRAT